MKNAGYKLVQIIANTKCFTPERTQAAIDIYADIVNGHDEVDAVLAQLAAHSAIENA